MNKKTSIILISVISFILLILSCTSLAEIFLSKKPTAEISRVDIESISLDSITFLFDIKVTNPYPISLSLAGIRTKFSVEEKQLFETSTKKPFAIEANGDSINPVSVNLKYADIINIVADYTKRENLNCDIDGEIIIALPNLGIKGIPESYSFPFKTSKLIPTFKPGLSVKEFYLVRPTNEEIKAAILKAGSKLNLFDVIKVIDKLTAGRYDEAFSIMKPEDLDLKFGVSFKILLKNETKSKINFNYFNYDFLMNNDPLISGATTKNIKSVDNTVTLDVSNTVSLVSFSRSIVAALKTNKADFKLTGVTEVKFPDYIKKEPLKLLIDSTGSVNITKK